MDHIKCIIYEHYEHIRLMLILTRSSQDPENVKKEALEFGGWKKTDRPLLFLLAYQ